MTFETVVDNLLLALPEVADWDRAHLNWLEDNRDLAYVIFGCLLIPMLEEALAQENMEFIQRACSFFEQASIDSIHDEKLDSLIGIEVGEWLGGIYQDRFMQCLGTETRRVCLSGGESSEQV